MHKNSTEHAETLFIALSEPTRPYIYKGVYFQLYKKHTLLYNSFISAHHDFLKVRPGGKIHKNSQSLCTVMQSTTSSVKFHKIVLHLVPILVALMISIIMYTMQVRDDTLTVFCLPCDH